MKTIVYVDGFNLYYGSVKDTRYKWLNTHRMCELLLPNNQIASVAALSTNDMIRHIHLSPVFSGWVYSQ